MKALSLFSAPVVAIMALIFGVVVVLAPNDLDAAAASSGCLPNDSTAITSVHLDQQQWQVAHKVIEAGKALHVPPRGWVIALAAGMQESGLRPLPYGDRDSLGVFQQRTSWGSAADRINPATSARMFYAGGHAGQPGLLEIAGWQRMPVTEAAQAVQASGFPDAYAKWEQLGVEVVARIAHVDATCKSGSTWSNPLGGAQYVLTAGFGECGTRWTHCHTGQDFAVPTGTLIVAAGAGIVTFAGRDGPYGNAVHVLHPSGIATWYAHLSRLETHRGAYVKSNQLIGLSGSTGNTTGPHLHLEVRINASSTSSGTPIDPMPWLHEQHIL